MSHGPQLQLAAASVRNISNHVNTVSTVPDTWMMFGFFAAIMLLGSFAIHERSARLVALRIVCLGALAVYGFAEGIWPLGMAVSFMSIREFIELRSRISGRWPMLASKSHGNALFAPETRLARLFGFDNEPETKPRTAKSKLSDEQSRYNDSMN